MILKILFVPGAFYKYVRGPRRMVLYLLIFQRATANLSHSFAPFINSGDSENCQTPRKSAQKFVGV